MNQRMIRIQKLFSPSDMDDQVIVDFLLQEQRPIVFQLILLDEFLELLYPRFESERKWVQFKQLFHHLSPSTKIELVKGLCELL